MSWRRGGACSPRAMRTATSRWRALLGRAEVGEVGAGNSGRRDPGCQEDQRREAASHRLLKGSGREAPSQNLRNHSVDLL
jgi:hypothetical protein